MRYMSVTSIHGPIVSARFPTSHVAMAIALAVLRQ